jgi:hypothetical protein
MSTHQAKRTFYLLLTKYGAKRQLDVLIILLHIGLSAESSSTQSEITYYEDIDKEWISWRRARVSLLCACQPVLCNKLPRLTKNVEVFDV